MILMTENLVIITVTMYINFNLILARILKQIIAIKKIYPMKNWKPDIININIQKIIIIVITPPQVQNHIKDTNMKKLIKVVGEKKENHHIKWGI